MNEWGAGLDTINMVSLLVSVVVIMVGLILWFFVNRASVRANQQIMLLEDLVELQKRQNSLLRRLCEANEPETVVTPPTNQKTTDEFVHMVAER